MIQQSGEKKQMGVAITPRQPASRLMIFGVTR